MIRLLVRKLFRPPIVYMVLLSLFLGLMTSSCVPAYNRQVVGDYLIVDPKNSDVIVSFRSNNQLFITEKSGFDDKINVIKGSYSIDGPNIEIIAENNVASGLFEGAGQIRFSVGSENFLLRKIQQGKRHIFIIDNGTEEFALVRIKSFRGVLHAEMSIEPGAKGRTRLPDGNYFEVVRFGKDSKNYRYAKGEGFSLSAPPGQYMKSTLTLHTTPSGRYSTFHATKDDF